MVSVVCSICGHVIGMSVLDIYVGGMFKYSDCTYWTCGQCCVFHMLVVGSNIVIIRTVRTGHVVSVVCSVSWWWDLI